VLVEELITGDFVLVILAIVISLFAGSAIVVVILIFYS
jgi:hypothetical protein